MKILYIVEACGAGTAKNVMSLANHLVLHYEAKITIIWSKERASKEWLDFLKDSRFKFVHIGMSANLGISDVSSYFSILKILSKVDLFDIVHCHSSKAGLYGRLLPKKYVKRLVYTPHAFVTMRQDGRVLANRVFSLAEKILARRTDAIVVVSKYESDHAISIGIPRSLLRLIVNGVSSSGYLDRFGDDRSRTNFVIGFFGRLDFQKNPKFFMRCIEHAHAIDGNIRAQIFGDGPLMSQLRGEGDEAIFEFFGWVETKDHLHNIDLLLCTSRYEGMPYIFLEALEAGIPIFSLKVGGVDEAIKHDENGYVFNQNVSFEEVADRITALARNKNKYQKYCAQSKIVSKLYTVETMVDKTYELYRKLQN